MEKKPTFPLLGNIEWRIVKTETEKINQVLTFISTENITELNELMYAGAKLDSEKIGASLKAHTHTHTHKKKKKKIKTWMGNSTGNANKKSTKTGKNDKPKEKRWNMLGQKEGSNARKNNNTTWGK